MIFPDPADSLPRPIASVKHVALRSRYPSFSSLGRFFRSVRTGLFGCFPDINLSEPRTKNSFKHGLSAIEMLAISIFLALGLAVMVSLARHVRSASAEGLTRIRLAQLVAAGDELFGGQLLPAGVRIDAKKTLVEEDLRSQAAISARLIIEAMELLDATRQSPIDSTGSQRLTPEQIATAGPSRWKRLAADGSFFDPVSVRDAWGSPIALIAASHSAIGLSPDDRPFFVSAGADRLYLTLADNIYSYDLPTPAPPTTLPQTASTRPFRPEDTGHGE